MRLSDEGVVVKEVPASYKKCQVPVQQLKFGMFVRELDRPWLGTPFTFQGFYIRSVEDVQKLQRLCEHVFIDLNKSRHVVKQLWTSADIEIENKLIESREQHWIPSSQALKSVDYEDVVSIEEELLSARASRARAIKVVEDLYAAARSGGSIDTASTRAAVISLVESVIRNPDVHALLAMLDECDPQRVTHSLNVCTLSLTLGRMLGLNSQYLIELGLGAILHDIGHAKIPAEIVNKKGLLNTDEYEIMKMHSLHGMRLLLEEAQQLPQRAVDIVYTHHERYDGYGYPRQLAGEAIPLYGRMVAITDFYEAVTSHYANMEKMTPGMAMTELFSMRGVNFDSKLVEEFIKCIGIFPIGCTVLLNTGEVGIVISQNRQSRLDPKLMLIVDKEGRFYPAPRVIDVKLFKAEQGLRVVSIVEPGKYGIDVKYHVGNMVQELEQAS